MWVFEGEIGKYHRYFPSTTLWIFRDFHGDWVIIVDNLMILTENKAIFA